MNQPENKINISKLLKARDVFEKVRQNMIDERDKMGATQAFEFCYELTWKYLKRYLSMQGKECSTPREVFREAALAGIIEDPEKWFYFQRQRNLSSHTYNIDALEEIVSSFELFSLELKKAINALEQRL